MFLPSPTTLWLSDFSEQAHGFAAVPEVYIKQANMEVIKHYRQAYTFKPRLIEYMQNILRENIVRDCLEKRSG